MSALRIADVVTLDCILSMRPLTFGLTAKRARADKAIALWCVYAQFTPAGSLPHAPDKGIDLRQLVARKMSARIARGVEQAIVREVEGVMFVASATASVTYEDDEIAIAETWTLVDGRTYALGVTIDEAGAALRRLGTI